MLLRPGATLSGNLVFDGRRTGGSAQQARIVVERANAGLPGSDPAIFAAIDDLGQFTATGLAAGSYFVRVLDSPVGWMFTGAMHNGRDLSEHPVEVRDDLAGVAIEFTNRWTGHSRHRHDTIRPDRLGRDRSALSDRLESLAHLHPECAANAQCACQGQR